MNETQHGEHSGEHFAMHGAPGGLAISAAGYTLHIGSKTFEAGREELFEFRILDQTGAPYATSTSSMRSACT